MRVLDNVKFKQILAIIWILCAQVTWAQGPPITTDTPVMLGLAGNGIRTFGKFIIKEKVKVYVHPIGIPYNVTSKFQIGAIVPFKVIDPNDGATSKGFSDIIFFSKHQIYKKDGKAKTFRILVNYKHIFPTGNIKSIPRLGSGLHKNYLGFILGKVTSKIGIYGDFGYNLVEGPASDQFSYNFSVGIPLLPQQYPQKQINTFLEFNGNYVFKPEIHTLFISPGITFIPGRRVLFETGFQYPILQKNIIDNKTKFTILLGTRFLLN